MPDGLSNQTEIKRLCIMKEDSNSSTGWASLDRDTLAAIVGLLEPREVAALACTCREARGAARNNAIWAPLLSRYFGLNTQAPDNVNLLSVFRILFRAFQTGTGNANGSNIIISSGSNRYSSWVGAVPLEGLYTDGGLDMSDAAFWAGNIFEPNGWSIYCSHTPNNVHCISMLKMASSENSFICSHRSEIIALASDVAWLLFLCRMPIRHVRSLIIAALTTTTSTPGTTATHRARVKAATVEAVTSPTTPATITETTIATTTPATTITTTYRSGGCRRSRVSGSSRPFVSQAQAQALASSLCRRLRWVMQTSLNLWSTEGLKQLMWQLLVHYKILHQKQHPQTLLGAGGDGGGGAAGLEEPMAAALPYPFPPLSGSKQELLLKLGVGGEGEGRDPGGAQVAAAQQRAAGGHVQPPPGYTEGLAAPLPDRLVLVARDMVHDWTLSGREALVGLGAVNAPPGGGGPAGAEGDGLQVWSRQARQYLCSTSLESTTAIVDGLTVSRTGEFTCPVSCGAIFMAQRRPVSLQRETEVAGLMAEPGCGTSHVGVSGGRTCFHDPRARQPSLTNEEVEEAKAQERVRLEFEGMVQQPYVQALSDVTSLELVEAAVAEGLLPPMIATGTCPGEGEWVEFQRPPPPPSYDNIASGSTRGSGYESAAGGGGDRGGADVEEGGSRTDGVFWPVVWFRFFPYDERDEADEGRVLPHILLQPPLPQQQQQQLLGFNELSLPVVNGIGGCVSTGAQSMGCDVPGADGSGEDAPLRSEGGGGGGGERAMSSGRSGRNDSGTLDGRGRDLGLEERGGMKGAERLEDDVHSLYYSQGMGFDITGEQTDGTDDDDDDDDDDGAVGGDGWHQDVTHTEECELDLDFLYGIEGQPYSFRATAGQYRSDSDDEFAEPVHPCGGGDASAAVFTAAAAGPSFSFGEATAVPAAKAHPMGRHAVKAQAEQSSRNDRVVNEPNHVTRSLKGSVTGDATATVGGSDGAGPSSASPFAFEPPAIYGRHEGGLLQGVPLLMWLNHLTEAHVAGGILGLVADAAGVQAIRHTFHNIMTALEPSAAAGAATAGATSSSSPTGTGHCTVGTPLASSAAASTSAAAIQTVTGAMGPMTTAASKALTTEAAVTAAVPVVLLLPDQSAECAFDGLPEAPPLLPPHPSNPLHLPLSTSQTPRPEPEAPPAAAATTPGATRGGGDGGGATMTAARPPSGHLVISLRQRWAGNSVLLKLISPENRAAAFGEDVDTAPNIDVQFVALRGVALSLRPPLRLLL